MTSSEALAELADPGNELSEETNAKLRRIIDAVAEDDEKNACMERDTNYALEQVYNIIDSRYRSKRPLIITTNLTLDEIRHPQDVAHARIYDRVLEMCVPVSCFGTSIRKDTAQEKLNNLKSLIG